MRINMHVERLVIEGLPVARHQAAQVHAAFEAELSRLLTAHGLDASLVSGASLARLNVGDLRLPRDGAHDPARLGAHIAAAVYGVLGGEVKR